MSVMTKIKKVFKSAVNAIGYDFINIKKSSPHLRQDIIEANNVERSIISTSSKYSMTSKISLWSVIQSIRHIKEHDLQGDIVECGVWRGGNIICASLMCDYLKIKKKIWAFDTYAGMPKPSKEDYRISNLLPAVKDWDKRQKKGKNTWCHASFEEVSNNFKSMLSGVDNIKMIKGEVEKTLNKLDIPSKISLLRLDTDWYSSTKKSLEVLYPRLQPKGILIIDDYGHWEGVRKAVDEYFKGKYAWFHYINHSVRLLNKTYTQLTTHKNKYNRICR